MNSIDESNIFLTNVTIGSFGSFEAWQWRMATDQGRARVHRRTRINPGPIALLILYLACNRPTDSASSEKKKSHFRGRPFN